LELAIDFCKQERLFNKRLLVQLMSYHFLVAEAIYKQHLSLGTETELSGISEPKLDFLAFPNVPETIPEGFSGISEPKLDFLAFPNFKICSRPTDSEA
jgi:hypothetical protein